MATTPGIDVSHHQSKITWADVPTGGYRFAVVRATMGISGVDTRFAENFDGAKRAGLLTSAYHLIRPEHSGAAQVGHFLNMVGDRTPDLPLVLDVELDGNDAISAHPQPARTPEEIAVCVHEAATLIEARTGRAPIIYTARWFWERRVAPLQDWSRYPLWVAQYNDTAPALPSAWNEWAFWQHTDRGQVPGITTPCDLNVFAGSYEDLLRFAAGEGGEENALRRVSLPPLPARLTVTAQVLNIRTGPDSSFGVVGKLRQGQTVPIRDLNGREVWVQVAADKWAALASASGRWMQIDVDAGGTLQAVVTADKLNIRNGPNMNFADVGDLFKGDRVPVCKLSGSNIWAEFEAGQWVALTAGGRNFAEVL